MGSGVPSIARSGQALLASVAGPRHARTVPLTGKRLSYLLRHHPEAIGLSVDANGRVLVDELLRRLAAHGEPTTRAALDALVGGDDKGRFVIEGEHIRAAQGHSIPVDLTLEVTPPPPLLYHGTSTRFLTSIRARGLVRGARHHVHLSIDCESAQQVAARRRAPVVLTVRAGAMASAGHTFYRSINGVWLVDAVPGGFIDP